MFGNIKTCDMCFEKKESVGRKKYSKQYLLYIKAVCCEYDNVYVLFYISYFCEYFLLDL